MVGADELYSVIGVKIRDARERSAKRLSQVKLAQILGISRASIVNIEAGRQHASLHLLWRIAEVLETDLVMLIPRRAEFVTNQDPVELNDVMLKRIRLEAGGDTAMERKLTSVVGKLLTTLEDEPSGGPHE